MVAPAWLGKERLVLAVRDAVGGYGVAGRVRSAEVCQRQVLARCRLGEVGCGRLDPLGHGIVRHDTVGRGGAGSAWLG